MMLGQPENRHHADGTGAAQIARRYRFRTLSASLALLLLVLPVAHAQQNTTADSNNETPLVDEQKTLPTIAVTATRIAQPAFEVPASIGVVSEDEIVEGAPAFSLSQSLARIPGVVAQNRQSYAQDTQLSIRGFGSRASFGVRGIRLLVDGIPVSGPDGQGQTDVFNLASADRIEVLRGPFSALYGNAAGGVIQVFTKDGLPQPTFGVSTLFGSDGTRIQRLDTGGSVGNFNYLIDGTHFRTDGYRDHSAAERDNLRAKLRYDFSEDSSLTLLFNAENQPVAEDPSSLTKQQVRDNPRQAVANTFRFGSGESHRDRQLGAVYEQRINQDNHLHVTSYAGSRRVLQFLPFAGSSANGGGSVIDLDNTSKGGGIRWTHNALLGSAPLDLIVGAEYDRLDEMREGFVNDLGVRGALRRDEDNASSQAGQYVQAEWQPDNWRIVVGLRHSRVTFDSDDQYVTPADPDDSGKQDFASTDPIAGVLYKINPHLNVYANYGRGFETPTLSEFAYRPDGTAGFNQDLLPSNSRAYETGLKGSWDSTHFDFSIFRIKTANDIIVGASNDGRTSFTNAGRTDRTGMELNIEQNFSGGFGAYVAYSYLKARFDGGLLDGNSLPGVPEQMIYGELNWRYHPLGFSTSINAQWRDRVYVNNQNAEFAESYTVVNYNLGFQQNTGGWQFREFAQINNIFDRNYIAAVVVNSGNGRFYQPAPERNVMLGLSANYAF